MSTIAELLASSLSLEDIQDGSDLMIVKSSQIPIGHLEMLMSKNFIKETTKGWYVVLDPRAIPFFKAKKRSPGRAVRVA